MIITFLGHRDLYECEYLCEKIKKALTENIKSDESTLFYCGGYGDFDNLCARACRSIKEKRSNCELIFVTPYITASQQEKMKYLIDSKLYDSIIYPPLEKIPPRLAIIQRNEWMINEADIVITYVNRTYGGAYKSLIYAKRLKKKIIDLTV